MTEKGKPGVRKVLLRKAAAGRYIRVVETDGVKEDLSGAISKDTAFSWLLSEAMPGMCRKIQAMVASADREFERVQREEKKGANDNFELADEDFAEEGEVDDQPDTVTED